MPAITDDLDGAANVLLAAPSMGGSRDVCTSLLTEGVDAPNVIFVTYTRQAPACVQQWEDAGAEASNIAVITVGDGGADLDQEGVFTENVGTPSDLTGLGIQIGQALSEWDPPVVVCFDSLTSMLQYVDFETAYEFLHAITGQLHAADARAHFHIDPDAHDTKEVEGITSLFDARVDAVEGDPMVRTRDVLQ